MTLEEVKGGVEKADKRRKRDEKWSIDCSMDWFTVLLREGFAFFSNDAFPFSF